MVADSWKVYLKAAYPLGVTEEQRQQLERAFYAGALVAITSITQCAALEEDQGVERVGALMDECQAFAQAQLLKAGDA